MLIFSTKLTAIFAPIRSMFLSVHQNHSKGSVRVPISRTDLKREGDTHEQIDSFQNTKQCFKARFLIFDPCNVNISTTSEWVGKIFSCTY